MQQLYPPVVPCVLMGTNEVGNYCYYNTSQFLLKKGIWICDHPSFLTTRNNNHIGGDFQAKILVRLLSHLCHLTFPLKPMYKDAHSHTISHVSLLSRVNVKSYLSAVDFNRFSWPSSFLATVHLSDWCCGVSLQVSEYASRHSSIYSWQSTMEESRSRCPSSFYGHSTGQDELASEH